MLGDGVAGSVETGRWYDVRIEVKGAGIRCFLDGKQIHDVKASRTVPPLHVVAGRAERSGEIIVKTVNVSNWDYDTAIRLEGVRGVQPTGLATILTSASPADENSVEQPTKVAPVKEPIQGAAASFRHTFPAHSLTVLRVKAE